MSVPHSGNLQNQAESPVPKNTRKSTRRSFLTKSLATTVIVGGGLYCAGSQTGLNERMQSGEFNSASGGLTSFFKDILLFLGTVTGWFSYMERKREKLYGHYIRIVFYHSTPAESVPNLRKHFAFFAKQYEPAKWDDLVGMISGERPWTKKKPGILISFDDGFSSNFEYARPLLKEFGLTGIFLVPPGLIDKHHTNQEILLAKTPEKNQVVMTWEQIKVLMSENHQIAAHTYSHHHFRIEDSPAVLHHEITECKKVLETRLAHSVTTFSFAFGSDDVYQATAYQEIRAAGYQYVLTTLSGVNQFGTNPFLLRRTGLVTDMSIARLRLNLLPFARYDPLGDNRAEYIAKRAKLK